MSKTKRALTTTFGLTFILFSFIVFLLYVIYCYAYYDKYLEYQYTNNINNHEYDFVYDTLFDKGNLTYEQFIFSINKLDNVERIENIYNNYYKDTGLYDIDEFMDTYLFEIDNVVEEDIIFSSSGNTNLISRKTIFYDQIKLSNKKNSISLGAFNKISFKIENNSILRLDNKELECVNNVCVIDKMFGGIYEVSYLSNLDSLVKVKEFDNVLKFGRYKLTSCDLIGCPLIDKSYLMINMDNTYYIHKIYKDGTSSNKVGNYIVNDNTIVLDEETFIINGRNLVGEEKDIYSYVD